MSVRFDTAGERLKYTGTLLDVNAAYTLMGWVNTAVDDGTTHRVFSFNPSGTNAAPRDEFNAVQSGGVLLAEARNEASSVLGATVFALDTWYHVALVRTSDTTLLLYLDGALEVTNTAASVTGRAGINELDLGGLVAAANRWHNGRIAFVKAWTRALAVGDVASEMRTVMPRDATSLWAWWPMLPGATERLLDLSGNGRTLTADGTVADEDSPPVSYRGSRLWALPTVSAPAVTVAARRSSSPIGARAGSRQAS